MKRAVACLFLLVVLSTTGCMFRHERGRRISWITGLPAFLLAPTSKEGDAWRRHRQPLPGEEFMYPYQSAIRPDPRAFRELDQAEELNDPPEPAEELPESETP